MRSGEIVDGRFELESRASSGGMGTIWRAKDLATSETVALKVLRDPDHGAERFLSEARILARLEHPCIVRHMGHGLTAEGEPYLVMEWLSGEDLATRLSRAPLEIDAGLALVRNVADGLSAAHARGIVHRDIKPSNIFLVGRRVDRIKLLDFGIARASTGSTVLTRSSSVLGTPGYMAPEQARGDEVVGPRADVFSLGCVLFECLAGRPAFQGSHPMALLAKLLLEEPPELAVVRPEVSGSVSSLCARMLSKDPSQRPADGAALVAELVAIGGITSSSSPSVRSMTPSRLSERERRLLSIVAISGTSRGALDEVRRIAEPLGAFVDTLAGGTILMVLPGVGSPADQVVRAARAALAIQGASPDRIVALVTGRSDLADRLPVGDLVELVALLLDSAREHGRPGVIVDEVTRALLDPRFEVEEHAGHVWLRSEHARGEETRTLLGNPSPFVGRERELTTLLDLLQQEFDEQRAQSVLVTAPAGMGKSRLRQELIAKLQLEIPDLCLAVGRADAMRSGAAFSVIASALRMLMEIEVGERREVQQEKVSSAVRALLSGEAAERTAPFLGELVGASFPDERNPLLRSARENAPLMAGRIESAWVEFMRAAARKGPTLLVLEDLHWGDGSSVKLVDTTLRELRDEPFAVVAFARPDIHDLFPRIWAERTHEVRLGPLPRRAASALVRAALGDDVDDALVAGLVARSEGNAFYLEELVRAFTEGRSSGLPETVLGMVEARLAALPPDVRHFLRAASVYGEVFWPNGVRRLLGGRRPVNVDAALDYAVAREFVTRRNSRRFVGEEEYAFRHALLREGAYAMLTERDRALGHGLAGAWLERVGEPDPSVLAMHFERGGQGARAAFWHARAAQTAMRGNDLQAGVRAVERGLAAGPTDEVATDLWALRARIASASGDYEASLAAAEEALRRTTPGSVAHCIALEGAIGGAMLLGRHDTLKDLSRRVLQTEPAPNALSALARALAPLIAALAASGNADAFVFLEKMRATLAASIEVEPSRAGALAYASAMVEKNLGRNPWLARQYALDGVRFLEEGGERHVVPMVTALLVGICTDLGAFEEAESWLDRTETRPSSMAANVVPAYLAQLRLAQGRFEEAITMSRTVAERVHGKDGNVVSALGSITLIEAHIERGDVEAAESLIDTTSSRGNQLVGAACAWFRSRVLLARGRAAEAANVCREALVLHRQIGPRGVERVLLTLAEALMAAGDAEAAKATLREAHNELGAREAAIGDPVYRRHFVERVPGNVRIRRLVGAWLGGGSA
ncbi:serine/threonine-protein kinase [Polyangium sp. y55x31]|uniref:serine/threonine-protein kinase n=1 Tax=Polyangium sp. y55x31 TaxID=3042688 RepID=UPI0024830AEC|nr:serine/threonine-protein kinase [Polyangium sp. y55x31]MDI1477608.1 protein kinase [Polyangium sp. y55x31]